MSNVIKTISRVNHSPKHKKYAGIYKIVDCGACNFLLPTAIDFTTNNTMTVLKIT